MPEEMGSIFGACWKKRSRKVEGVHSIINSDYASVHLKDITVRVIHAGGKEEQFRGPIPAANLTEKYPGMCVARPQIFKNPHESLLSDDDKLMPGHKYYIIPHTTVQKIKRKHSMKGRKVQGEDCRGESEHGIKDTDDDDDDFSEESVCSAKDFYVSKERWEEGCHVKRKNCRKGKEQFVPPIQKPRLFKGSDWEPSLTSVQELSP